MPDKTYETYARRVILPTSRGPDEEGMRNHRGVICLLYM